MEIMISTHTLTWSVTYEVAAVLLSAVHFNSHAHVERDLPILSQEAISEISTHTLTWSVTCKTYLRTYFTKNFNSHAHVERDEAVISTIRTLTAFQLTRSRGA